MSKPDRTAHVLGVFGFALSLISIGWQVYVYHDSFAEKALVRLYSYQRFVSHNVSSSFPQDRKGDLRVEVVNIGQHPLYVRRVSLTVPCPWIDGSENRGFDPENMPANASLEPGAAAMYHTKDWDFLRHSLDSPGDPTKKEAYCVTVESNKGVVSRSSPGLSHAYTIEVIEGRK
jgi:hypothetical protein